MIMPTKHVRAERALIGVGAEVLAIMREPMTVSRLWNEIRDRRSVSSPNAPIDYNWFILALDLLFMIGVIETRTGVVSRAKP